MAREEPITPEQGEKILDLLRTWMNVNNLTQAKAGRLIGIGDSVLSQLFGGNYGASPDNMLRNIQKFLDREAERSEAPSGNTFVETSVAKSIMRCLRANHIHSTVGAVFGDAGKGKTMAFREYTRTTPGTYLVSASRWVRTPSQLAKRIVAVAVKEAPRITLAEAARLLLDKLSGKSALLIIDQAHQLNEDALEFVQNLHDELNATAPEDGGSDNRFGIVLGATMRLDKWIQEERNHYLIEQLHSRIDVGFTARLKEPFNMADIKFIFTPAAIKYPLPTMTLQYLLELANGRGGLRTAVATVRHQEELYIKRKIPTSTDILPKDLDNARKLMLQAA